MQNFACVEVATTVDHDRGVYREEGESHRENMIELLAGRFLIYRFSFFLNDFFRSAGRVLL